MMPSSNRLEPVSCWRHLLKGIAVPALHRSGALWLSQRFEPRQCRIALNYHNVESRVFEAHAAFLQRSAEVVDLETFLSRPVARRGKPLVTLTFDDGYVSFEELILPILARFKLPATWFVSTALVETGGLFWFDRLRAAVRASARTRFTFQGHAWALQRWNRDYVAAAISKRIKRAARAEQSALVDDAIALIGEAPEAVQRTYALTSRAALRALDPQLITIGSHSHTHPQLSQLSPAALEEELTVSKRLLEEWSGQAVRHFAYPSGDYDAAVIRAIQAAGYASAWTTEPRFCAPEDDPYRMPRVPIDDRASVSILSAKMSPWVHRWGRL